MEVLSFIGGQFLKAVIMKKEPSSCMATPEKYICNICNFKTNLWVEFKQHVAKTKIKLLGIAYVCEGCNFETYSRLVLTRHIYGDCKMAKTNTTPILVHFKGRGLKLFHCMQPEPKQLQPLIKTKPKTCECHQLICQIPQLSSCTTPLELYECKTCSFRTPFWVEFIEHVETTKNTIKFIGPVYICEACNFETYSQLVLLKHVRNSCRMAQSDTTPVPVYCKGHGGPDKIIFFQGKTPTKLEKLFQCEQCSYKTQYRSSLKRHSFTKHTPKKIVWQQCDLSSTKKHKASLHVRAVKWFECEQCGYKAMRRLHLRSHVREAHTVVKQAMWFKCEHCVYETKRGDHFRRHVQEKHTPADEFEWLKCEHCSYKAKQKCHLKLHVIQRHTASEDIKWFQCEQCSYKAKIKASLKEHMFNRHMGSDKLSWLKCTECSYKTKREDLLDKHVKKKHTTKCVG